MILTLNVICPATPSSYPYFAKIRKAKARRPFKYSLALYGLSNFGGPISAAVGIWTDASSGRLRAELALLSLLGVWLLVALGAMVNGEFEAIGSRYYRGRLLEENSD